MENSLADDIQLDNLQTEASITEPVIRIRNAYKHYGSDNNPIIILNNLNMTVPKGTIYGLLGASGCGKTTLLNCIVGRKKLISGNIWVLGGTPGTKHSSVPGPQFGYMPQSINLYGGFTIRETLQFFGCISGMPAAKIEERACFFIKLLMLPSGDEFVGNLSVGQQRRVSLAVALLHEPELLILDEPTVGLDPILRESIWNYFVQVAFECNITIVITTHYIDEASQAHIVALMREGTLLAEESPKQLLSHYNSQTLESAFFTLSNAQQIKDSGDYINNLKTAVAFGGGEQNIASDNTNRNAFAIHQYFCNNLLKGKHLKALLWKNFSWMLRNIPIVLCVLVLPFVQTVLFCTCIGNDPRDLLVATINYETNNKTCESQFTCKDLHLGCHYLKYLENRNLTLVHYQTEEAVKESVLKGRTYASIVVPQNFSKSLQAWINGWRDLNVADIYSSEITVFRDVSSSLVSQFLKSLIYDTFKHFLDDYMAMCNIDSRWLTSPIRLEKPVYGEKEPKFIDFVSPAVLLSTVSFLAAALTCMALFLERNEGILERCLVIGINQVEMLLSHLICLSVIMASQSLITLVCFFAIFNITMKGSMILVTILTLMVGFFGMCGGLLISSIANAEAPAFLATMGSYMVVVTLGGVLWPIEGMHYLLRYIAVVLPFTQTTETARNIMHRGWGLTHAAVYMGFLSIIVWTLIIIVIIILVLKYKKE